MSNHEARGQRCLGGRSMCMRQIWRIGWYWSGALHPCNCSQAR